MLGAARRRRDPGPRPPTWWTSRRRQRADRLPRPPRVEDREPARSRTPRSRPVPTRLHGSRDPRLGRRQTAHNRRGAANATFGGIRHLGTSQGDSGRLVSDGAHRDPRPRPGDCSRDRHPPDGHGRRPENSHRPASAPTRLRLTGRTALVSPTSQGGSLLAPGMVARLAASHDHYATTRLIPDFDSEPGTIITVPSICLTGTPEDVMPFDFHTL